MKVTLYYKYLMHDIDQWTYRLANVRIENPDLKSSAQSSSVATDVSFYRRKIEDGVAHLRMILSDELVKTHEDADDILDLNKASWEFQFKEDTSVSADSTACAEKMHRFVLMHVIRDWAGVYAPDAASMAESNLEDAKNALDEGLYALELPIKHRRPIFTEITEVSID